MYYREKDSLQIYYEAQIKGALKFFYDTVPRIQVQLKKGFNKFEFKTMDILDIPYISISEIDHSIKQLEKMNIDISNMVDTKKVINDFNELHSIDDDLYGSFLHNRINHRRTDYDMSVENYTYDVDNDVFDEFDDAFDHDILFLRDQIEHTFLGIKLVGNNSIYRWYDRMKEKIQNVDKELEKILPLIAEKWTKRNPPITIVTPNSFWWRNIEYEIRKQN